MVGGQHHAPTALSPGTRTGEPQGRFGRLRKFSPPTRIRSPDRSARSESLYRLSYYEPQISCNFVYESSLSSGSVCVCVCGGGEVRLGSGFGNKQDQNLGLCVCKAGLKFGVTLCIKSFRFWICTCVNSFRIGYFTLLQTFTLIFSVTTHAYTISASGVTRNQRKTNRCYI